MSPAALLTISFIHRFLRYLALGLFLRLALVANTLHRLVLDCAMTPQPAFLPLYCSQLSDNLHSRDLLQSRLHDLRFVSHG